MHHKLSALLIFVSLSAPQALQAQTEDCARKASFGDIEICLPQIKGYSECYEDPIVKKFADATEVPMNEVIGYYLNPEDHAVRIGIEENGADDYFKVYGTTQLATTPVGLKEFESFAEMMSGNFISANWDEISEQIGKAELDIQIGAPTLLEDYSLDPRSFTLVALVKYELGPGVTATLSMTINGLLIHGRAIWMAYYRIFESEETLVALKESSDRIIREMLAANPQ